MTHEKGLCIDQLETKIILVIGSVTLPHGDIYDRHLHVCRKLLQLIIVHVREVQQDWVTIS